jgi:hypothetical protein
MADRLMDWDSSFINGVNSSMEPTALPIGYYWSGINMITIAGVPSCRPGYRCVAQLPKGNLQGAAIFRPLVGIEQILIAIDGVIYVAEYPFKEYRFLTNVQMSPTAKQMFWAQTIQSVERVNPGSLTSAIEVIVPRAVMFIQDGGFSAPAWYDGTDSGHVRGIPFQTPIGSSMKWVGDRLWVANKSLVFASDISNPFSFIEQIYLGGTSSFNFASDVTALVATPSVDAPQLLVFTAEETSILQANIRNRDLWPDTENFQREILQVGCVSSRAVSSNFGALIWLSPQGITFYNAASSQYVTSRSPIRDNEMLVSKTLLATDLSLAAIGSFGQWMVISLPAEDNFNKHTWVLNSASWESLKDSGGPTWNGYWLGTRPVEWVYGEIAGTERIYHVSTDEDDENRLWEAFLTERLDNGCPILWAAFTRGYFGQSSEVKKPPGNPCRFLFADVAFAGIEEPLDLGIFVAPGMRGQFQKILSKRFSVDRGSLSFDREFTATSDLFAFKPQSRIPRTEDLNQQSPNQESGSCPVESDKNDGVEESFQLLIVGHGPATLRYVRPFALLAPDENLSGDPRACINEEGCNALRFDGAGVHADNCADIDDELAAKPLDYYTANKTAVVSVDGITAVGVGFSESIVSQDAVDRVAERIAVKMAETEVAMQLPTVLSVGEGFDS